MSPSTKDRGKIRQERRQMFEEVVNAFGEKYSWLGGQAARQMLLSAASYNLNKYSDPPFRYRNHLMLAWRRGWVKSTLLRNMADILGDGMCSTLGKVTEAAMRGSVSSGVFTPPKPLKTPIVISTEFGQTNFDDELLNIFLALLEEGRTNISLNKLGSLPESQKQQIEQRFDGMIEFGETNEFDLQTDFVFWGATYDPSKLSDDALRSRFNVVTPAKELNHEIVKAMDTTPSVKTLIDKTTVQDIRRELNREKKMETEFLPTDSLYSGYDIEPRESRDIQAYMASLNWWGLEVDPDVMESFLQHLRNSRKKSTMNPKERVFDLIFDTPKSYKEIMDETGYDEKEIYKILQSLDAAKTVVNGIEKYVIYSGKGNNYSEHNEQEDDSLSADDFLDSV